MEAGGYYGNCPSGSWFWLRAEYGLIRDGRKGIHLEGRQRVKGEEGNIASLLGVGMGRPSLILILGRISSLCRSHFPICRK